MTTVRPVDHPLAPRPQRDPGWRPRALSLALLALATVAVAAVTAYALAGLADPRYGARTDLLYGLGGAGSEPEADRLLATQVVMLRSQAVIGPVAARHGIDPELLAERVTAELLDGSQVIQLTVSDRDPERALALATELADRYLEVGRATLGGGAPQRPGDAGARTLTPPYLLSEPLWPRPLQAAAGGSIAGIVLATALVLGAYRLRRRA